MTIMGCNNQNIKFNGELVIVNSKVRNYSFIQNCFWRIETILKSQTKHDWKLNFHFWGVIKVFLAAKKSNQTYTKNVLLSQLKMFNGTYKKLSLSHQYNS